MQQIRFRLGLHPTPRWGSLQRSPRPCSWISGVLLPMERRGRREGGERGREDGKGKGQGREEGKGREGKSEEKGEGRSLILPAHFPYPLATYGEHHKISTETRMTCYTLNTDSYSNLLLNTICFVWLSLFGWRTLNSNE